MSLNRKWFELGNVTSARICPVGYITFNGVLFIHFYFTRGVKKLYFSPLHFGRTPISGTQQSVVMTLNGSGERTVVVVGGRKKYFWLYGTSLHNLFYSFKEKRLGHYSSRGKNMRTRVPSFPRFLSLEAPIKLSSLIHLLLWTPPPARPFCAFNTFR